MDSALYPFAGAEWLAALHITNVMAADQYAEWLDGREYSICETYVDVPTEVDPPGRVSWTLRVSGDRVSFAAVECDDVDLKVVADWAIYRAIVRMTMATEAAQIQEFMGKAVADGTITIVGEMTTIPPFAPKAHDAMASVTA